MRMGKLMCHCDERCSRTSDFDYIYGRIGCLYHDYEELVRHTNINFELLATMAQRRWMRCCFSDISVTELNSDYSDYLWDYYLENPVAQELHIGKV